MSSRNFKESSTAMTTDEAIIDFCNAVEATCVKLRMGLGDKPAVNHPGQIQNSKVPAVNEEVFLTLKFDPWHSDKMGAYEVAGRQSNDAYKFADAYKILETAGASIKTRYHGKDYVNSYWLFGEDKIYRQKLKGELKT